MNELYPKVEQILKGYTNQSMEALIELIRVTPGEIGVLFDCPANIEYLLKRFIGGCLARDQDFKFNSFIALTIVAKQDIATLNKKLLSTYILELADHRKHCGGKNVQVESYVIGKLLIFKALSHILANQPTVIANLTALLPEFMHLEEQILQVLFKYSNKKSSKAEFLKVKTNSKSGSLLHRIFCSKLSKNEVEFTAEEIDEVLNENLQTYPKDSLCLMYVGNQLEKSLGNSGAYFKKKLSPYFEADSTEEIRLLYYIISLMKSHLKSVKITSQNYQSVLSIEMIKAWLEQTRVKNKAMKSLIEDFTIEFEKNSELAFSLLKEFHEANVYLENVSLNHPLADLYLHVDAKKYWEYLCSLKDQEKVNQDEEKAEGCFSEIQFLVRHRYDQFSFEEVGKTIELLISKYNSSKSENNLNTIWNLINFVLKNKNKKAKINLKAAIILSKINPKQLISSEHFKVYNQTSKYIRLKIKENKNTEDSLKIAFYNFILAVVYFAMVYPEESEVFSEIQMIEKELEESIFSGEKVSKKKKSKTEEEEKKAVHVLIDIFISLLTKSPHFLRDAITHLFELLIPHLDASDLKQLLEVVERPDHEYIEEI